MFCPGALPRAHHHSFLAPCTSAHGTPARGIAVAPHGIIKVQFCSTAALLNPAEQNMSTTCLRSANGPGLELLAASEQSGMTAVLAASNRDCHVSFPQQKSEKPKYIDFSQQIYLEHTATFHSNTAT